MFLGFFLHMYLSSKSMKNLSEKGKKHYTLVKFFWGYISSDYFTPLGQKYRSLSWKVAFPLFVFGFILGVILSINL